MLKVLAIVPARAGSKRLPHKNVRKLNGIPLVGYSFDAATASKYISHTIATSDCQEVLTIAKQYENTTALLRPAELASDTASSIDVIKHAVEYAQQEGIVFDTICLLQPTSPLRSADDIDKAIELYMAKNAKGVVSMTECSHSPLWTTQLDTEEQFKLFVDSLTGARSQDLPKYYQLNGAIYLIDKAEFQQQGKLFFEQDFYPFIMSTENSVDIDTEIDFLLAEQLVKKVV
ncbi:acylneuraminate cytidylyltransferase family protein [Pseudoalteromonas sp. Of7M-16]|uniref:acylneuraminate cytidylyltransferase family protein n=1 Tax=Pseudoalteromonas sp. Of7M-16 TaxID=2917756 RepID=UPI001EF4F8E9|nr:acylneuraminate cytidylyltransferase family protein [Pseudoalteromonas sp. Of7M-16]MCG7547222.1 acylneuraminate cytidylyltransferase family protein [Pseudoalteromonas sp. Of7M-16]